MDPQVKTRKCSTSVWHIQKSFGVGNKLCHTAMNKTTNEFLGKIEYPALEKALIVHSENIWNCLVARMILFQLSIIEMTGCGSEATNILHLAGDIFCRRFQTDAVIFLI